MLVSSTRLLSTQAMLAPLPDHTKAQHGKTGHIHSFPGVLLQTLPEKAHVCLQGYTQDSASLACKTQVIQSETSAEADQEKGGLCKIAFSVL